MKVSSDLMNTLTRSLTESMDIRTMTVLIKKWISDYDLNKRTGFPESIPIPSRDAARQIVNDVIGANLLPYFVNELMIISTEGLMGKKYSVNYLNQIVQEVLEMGFVYDSENKMFIEDSNVRRTRNWGTLMVNEEYVFSFLRLDIVGNSKLVREYPESVIKATYGDLKKIVDYAIDMREGRVWNWEGDGGLVAFYFSNKNLLATLSAMEIIHELFVYNQIKNKLKDPLQARIAVHGGLCEYIKDYQELMKSEIIKKTIEIEAKYTKPNTLTISNNVAFSLDEKLKNQFQLVKGEHGATYYNYELKWEQ